MPITRRTCLKRLSYVMAANALPGIAGPALAIDANSRPDKPSSQEMDAIEQIARQFMRQFNAPGLSLSIACRGNVVFSGAYGYADLSARERMTAAHRFRIASVSKPITSAAIFTLAEQRKIKLSDTIFGNNGLLKNDYGNFYPAGAEDITVLHLLTHTCGGWGNQQNDPMFSNPEMSHSQLIQWTLRKQSLGFAPGTHFAYSNFGYCLLGRVIEKISRQSYREFVLRNIAEKCHIGSMQLAENGLAGRAENEVIYYGQNHEDPYDINIKRMDAHGGWLASPADLVSFAMHVDGFNTTPNILRPETIRTMTEPGAVNPAYACGWAVNGRPNWWHNGSLPGVASLLVRTASGLCWAAVTNTRANGIDLALDEMMWKIVKAVPQWRA